MTRDADRQDEYLRRATELDDERAALLADPVARDALLKEIIRMPTINPTEPAHPAHPARPRRPRLAMALTAAAAVGAIAVGVTVVAARTASGPGGSPVAGPVDGSVRASVDGPERSAPSTTPAGPVGDVFAGAGANQCAEAYSPNQVKKRRFAFDGTVTRVSPQTSAGVGHPAYSAVTFTVHRWYSGGTAEQFTVDMLPPQAVSSVNSPTYRVGLRLLVSGEDRWGDTALTKPVAWPCGFTRHHTEADVRAWGKAFAG